MIKRSFARLLCVLLFTVLLCALASGAYADAGVCSCTQEMDPRCTCGCHTDAVPSREMLLERFLACLFEAEDEKDPVAKGHLYAEAQDLWDAYLDTAYDELDAMTIVSQPTLEELFAAFQETVLAAEAERDPARRAALFEQAQLFWDAYLDLAYSADEPERGEDAYGRTEEDEYLDDESFGIIGGSDSPTVLSVTGNADEMPESEEPRVEDEYLDTFSEPAPPAEEAAFDAGEDNIHPDAVTAAANEMLADYLANLLVDTFYDNLEWDAPLTGGVGIPNPWTQTDLLDEAVRISGVDFCPPAEESLPQDMLLMWYRATPGILEADYSNGEEELMLRASTEDEGYILSGDYNSYSREWTETVDGVAVDCLGDGERINVAMFKSGDTAYALTMACGREGVGLTVNELAALVKAMLPASEPDISAESDDIYADPVDIYADPVPQESISDAAQPEPETNGDIVVLFTGNVRCGIDEGFGYAGLKALRDSLEAQGCTTILADGGNAVQGGTIGTLSKGMAVIDFMNALGYDVAVPGGHEFDYGTDRFLELAKAADYPYIACNFTHADESALEPYVMFEAGGKRIAFIGLTIPAAEEMPIQSGFVNEEGKTIIGFMLNAGDEALYNTVQSAVDSALEEGADLVCVLGSAGAEGFGCADIIANTTGIDLFFDAFSDDAQTCRDKIGDNVVCIPGGEKLGGIGYCRIAADGSIIESGVWRWPNSSSAAVLFGVDNDISEMTEAAKQKLDQELGAVVTYADTALDDVDGESGRMETSIGDFCADALRVQSGAEIGLVSAGLIRAGIEEGEVTFGDILNVFPDGNTVRLIGLTGRQLLDALEWGCRDLPEASDSFLQVSGLSFTLRTDIESPCVLDDEGLLTVTGERRVDNVLIGGESIDPDGIYTLACPDVLLLDNPALKGVWVLEDWGKADTQILVDYMIDDLGGYIETEGPGRILIVDFAAADEETEEDIYLSDADIAALNELFAQYLAERAAR